MLLRRWMARLAVRLLAPQQVPSTVDTDDWLCGQDVDEVHGGVGVGGALASEQVAPVLLDGYPCRPVRISSYEVSSRNHAESK